MDGLNLEELSRSDLSQINGGLILIGGIFKIIDFVEAFLEGHEEEWADKCKCACK